MSKAKRKRSGRPKAQRKRIAVAKSGAVWKLPWHKSRILMATLAATVLTATQNTIARVINVLGKSN